jgi:hypothetical protein
MGIGLIMSGLGQGIAQGGQAFGNAMIKSYEDERRDALESRRESALLNRQEALIKARSAQEKIDTEELAQANAKQSQAVVERAAEKPIERAAGQLLQRGAAAGASVEGMQSPEDLKAYMKEHPEYRKQLESSGIIAKETRLSKAEDEAKTALEMGTHSQVQKSFEAARSATLAEIKAENSKTRDEQKHEETLKGLGIRQQNADTAETRADNAGKEKTKEHRETTMDLQRKLDSAKDALADKLGTNKTEMYSALKSLRNQAKNNPAKEAELKALQPLIDKMDAHRVKLDAWEAKPMPTETPAPAPTNTPTSTNLAAPRTQAEFDKLPSGTRYTDPNGVIRIKR